MLYGTYLYMCIAKMQKNNFVNTIIDIINIIIILLYNIKLVPLMLVRKFQNTQPVNVFCINFSSK